MPAVKDKMKQVQDSFSKMDTKEMKNNMQKAITFVKNKLQDLRRSFENSKVTLKVNNTDAQKNISQIQKQIDSLNEKINARKMSLNIINPQIEKIINDTKKSVIPDGIAPNNKTMDSTVNNALNSNKDFKSLDAQTQKIIRRNRTVQ